MNRPGAAGSPVRAWFFLAAAIFLGAVRAAAGAQLLPADEAASRPDFFSYRARLQAALAGRDADALLAAADPHVKLSFGGDDGIEALRRWIAQPDSTVWSELGAVLALGGSFSEEKTFVAPYTFSRWPESLDAFGHAALIAADVRVRDAPRPDAAVLAVKSFTILPLAVEEGRAGGGAWTAVRLPGNRIGYVSADLIRSPIGYRAFFQRRDGGWRMTLFVAGD